MCYVLFPRRMKKKGLISMKKLFAVLLATLLLLSVSACSSSEAASSGTTSKIVVQGHGLLAEVPLKKLCKDSVTIVRGKIIDMESYDYKIVFDPEFSRDVVRTNITVQVDDVLKGDSELKEVVFWETGGETDTMIWKDHFLESYFIGYEGYFFISEEGNSRPFLSIRDGLITTTNTFVTVTKESELYAKIKPVSGSVYTSNPTYKAEDFELIVKNYLN